MTTRVKISATVDPDRLDRAKRVTGNTNVSNLLDLALSALIERVEEDRWIAAQPGEDLPGDVTVDLASVSWDA